MATDFAILLDPVRLAVAGAVATVPRDSQTIAELTDLKPSAVLVALGELRTAGLVTNLDGTYSLNHDALRELSERFAESDVPMDPSIGFGMTDAERAVLERYFAGRALERFPTQRAARLIVLERLALEFDIGKRIDEVEVNRVLGEFNRDTAALRRALVEEGLLDREHRDGKTWYLRSGGRVPR